VNLKDLLQEINDEVKIITASDFNIEIIETKYVPNTDDKALTFENFDTKTKKCKMIETCVLYIDIRKSTELSNQHQATTLSKLYSAFTKSMVKASRQFGGHVRNIIGDRVMVIFDSDNCFTNAVNTAILLNTVAHHILNKHFKNNEVKCGIGIDYGKMLVTKVGTIKKNIENQEYKYLTWLGKPANIASKLTDNANKSIVKFEDYIKVAYHYRITNQFSYENMPIGVFIDKLETQFNQYLKYPNEYFSFFVKYPEKFEKKTQPILITERVYSEYKKTNPLAKSIKEGWWTKQDIQVSEYKGNIYGADIIYIDINEVK
jgi:class 3 adenylate cyclase